MIHALPNSSYYAASVDPFPGQPALDHAVDADVCVVGGGFTGLAAALACAEKGLDTVLVEGDRIGNGASGRNGGQMIPGLNEYGQELIGLLGRTKAEALFRLAATARDRVHARISAHGIDCDLRHGHIHLAARKSDMADMMREADFANALLGDDSAQIISAADVGRHVSVAGYHGALLTPSGGHMHPMKYAHGLARAALDAGARIFERSRIVAVDDGPISLVRSAAGAVKAKHVILACDCDMDSVDRKASQYTMPVLNYIISTEPLGTDRAAALIPSGAAVSDSRFVLNYFRLSADNRMLFAGGEKYTARPPRDIAAFVRPFMLKLFPSLADARIDYAWGGAVGITVNRLPQFGRRGNMLFAHGYSGQGVLLATLAGEIMADTVAGNSGRFDQFAAIPHLPFPGGKLLRSPIYTAAMMYMALRDRL
jgi:gamma-glutamylputrescine oxidase